MEDAVVESVEWMIAVRYAFAKSVERENAGVIAGWSV